MLINWAWFIDDLPGLCHSFLKMLSRGESSCARAKIYKTIRHTNGKKMSLKW